MRTPVLPFALLSSALFLGACANNQPPVQPDGTRDASAQQQQNDKDLQSIQNDPHSFSALPTTQPLSDSKMPQNDK